MICKNIFCGDFSRWVKMGISSSEMPNSLANLRTDGGARIGIDLARETDCVVIIGC